MSEGGDDSDRKMESSDRDEATGDSASPRDKKTKLLTADGETAVPVSRARPLSAQDLLVAGRKLNYYYYYYYYCCTLFCLDSFCLTGRFFWS